jgi:hypothetical protein
VALHNTVIANDFPFNRFAAEKIRSSYPVASIDCLFLQHEPCADLWVLQIHYWCGDKRLDTNQKKFIREIYVEYN